MSDVDQALRAIEDWLLEQQREPIPEDWVPGSTAQERARLAPLDSIIASVVPISDAGQTTGSKILDEWLRAAPPAPEELVRLSQILANGADTQASSRLYSSLVSAANRRHLGTFFTPQSIVDKMIAQWREEFAAPSTIVDVGAGVGVFTASAMRSWPSANVYGVDVNPITLGLMAAQLKDYFTDSPSPHRLRLVLDDFVDWFTRFATQDTTSRLILGNPPYTRLQLIPKADRERILDAAGGLCGSRASLSAVITATAIQNLGAQDGLSLLLPTHWLESAYAEKLRSKIWSLRERPIRLELFEASHFSDARVDTVSLLIGPEGEVADFRTEVTTGDNRVTHDRLQPNPSNWRNLFHGTRRLSRSANPDTIPLGELATIRRGAATGSNAYFAISEDDRVAWRLPQSALTPLIRRLRTFSTDTITQKRLANLPAHEPRWLLSVDPTKPVPDPISEYLTEGLRQGVDLSELASRRDRWFDLSSEISLPDVVIGSMTRGKFRFVTNKAQATILNNLFGLTWQNDTDRDIRKEALLWLRSDPGHNAIAAQATTQGEGLLRVGPRALKEVRIPVLPS